jgi:hypothetical protein
MTESDERLTLELQLLESMYPENTSYSSKGRELTYSIEHRTLKLRIPDEYLSTELPEIISASVARIDIRNQLKSQIAELSPGEEVLDVIINTFNEACESAATVCHSPSSDLEKTHPVNASSDDRSATIIVWLHHLLNTNKRKQALSPPATVSGITKPGYPGVLIYSGPASAVHQHVNELKALNWQAFQLRMESEEKWSFGHEGVKEVESMKNIVAEIGEEKKLIFMEAMRMK